MKRFLAFTLIAVLGVFTIGCETKMDSTENKTETTTTQTKDGEITGQTTTTTTDTLETARPITPGDDATTNEIAE